jgi:hypothetical protein
MNKERQIDKKLGRYNVELCFARISFYIYTAGHMYATVFLRFQGANVRSSKLDRESQIFSLAKRGQMSRGKTELTNVRFPVSPSDQNSSNLHLSRTILPSL